MDHCHCFYCGSTSTTQSNGCEKCTDCQTYAFCSEEHWAYHKSENNACLPFKILKNEEFGRYMVATRAIKPFETVVTDQSLAVGPSEDTLACCLACLKPISQVEYVCEKCNLPLCGNEGCTNAAVHEPECLIFQRHQPEKLRVEPDSGIPHPLYSLVVPLRLLSLRQSQPQKWKLALTLTSHLGKRQGGDKKYTFIMSKAFPILTNCGVAQDDHDVIAQLMGILWSNAASLPRLRKNMSEPLGHALFPKFSILAHGCMANCRYNVSEDGRFVTVRALRQIQAGENLTIDYTDPLLGNFTRRKAFTDHWHFNCGCQRCSSATEMESYLSAVRCPDKDGYLLPDQPLERGSIWKCDRCGKPVSEEWVDQLTAKVKEMGSGINLTAQLSEWETYLSQVTSELHPNHYIAMNVKLIIVQLLGTLESLDSLERLQRKHELCLNYIQVYDKVSPGYTKWKGRILEHLSSTIVQLHRRLFEEGTIGQAEFFLAYKKSLMMLKEASKCRQFEPEEDNVMMCSLLKEHNDALSLVTSMMI